MPELEYTPFVCIKVPTGGGKTLIAAHSVGIIFKDYLSEKSDKGLAMWFVPSDALREGWDCPFAYMDNIIKEISEL